MQRTLTLLLLLCGLPAPAFCQGTTPQPILPDALHWAGFPLVPGIQGAWILGSEQTPGPYVLRVRLAADVRFPPHAHPDARSTTVLAGTLYVGFGETFNESKFVAVPTGAVYSAPAGLAHFLWAKDGDVEYQETGVGPTGTTLAIAMTTTTTVATTLATSTATVTPAQESALTALSWLAGCWGVEAAEAGSGESWLPPAGGSMLGVERTIQHGKTVSHGFMRIEANAEGKLVFTALPSGQEETSFTQLSLSRDAITFENLQHDFPQRVIYRSLSSDRIAARIEGTNGGLEQGIDFPMKRVSCESRLQPAATG